MKTAVAMALIFVMESKELIESCLHAKARSFICSRLKNLWEGGGVQMTPPGFICYSK